MESIIINGLKCPGEELENGFVIPIQNGNVFGKGVYVSKMS